MNHTIVFDKVSKTYKLGSTRDSLREVIPRLGKRLFKRNQAGGGTTQTFYALQDASFKVEAGESLGIIGPNGAGKTTALKLISKITKATKGSVRTQGRISALIELGAGFHPDLTGRDNIYLSAALLGMTRREIEERFDAIVAFSELERFLDTPVKRYSSGMYARLGFSVAAHVDPDILLTDEVLAVGDNAFQAKCYQRMGELKKRGTTIVFVSHTLPTLRRLCDRAILLFRGQIMADGDSAEVINTYMDNPRYASNLAEPSVELLESPDSQSPEEAGPLSITGVTFLNEEGQPISDCRTGDSITVRIDYAARQPISEPSVTIKFRGMDGTQYGGYNSGWDGVIPKIVEGIGSVSVTFEPFCLLSGLYLISVMIADREGLAPYDWHSRRYRLRVSSNPNASAHGLVYMPHTWHWYSNDRAQSPGERAVLDIGKSASSTAGG